MRIYEPCVCCEYPCGHVAHRSNGGSASTNVSGKLCAMPGAQRQHQSTMHPSDGRPTPGAPPASSAARQEALSLRGTNRTGTQNEEWGWIKRSHVMIYRDGKGDEATQSCLTTALYTYYIHITTKSPAKRCKKYKQSRLYLLHPPDVAMKCISTAEPEGLPLALRHHIT